MKHFLTNLFAKVYKNALDVRLDCFGSENLQVAVAHEDLAYATYVNEYSTGEPYYHLHHTNHPTPTRGL